MALRLPNNDKTKHVEAFINGADVPSPAQENQEKLSVEERLEKRAEGRNYPLYTLRGTESQHKLIKYAAEKHGISQNKLIQKYLLEVLEEEFGDNVSVM